MGLDWLAGNKAKPGQEGRFRELLERIVAGDELDEAETAEWETIGVPAYTTLDAPRVGMDEPATAWYLERLRQQKSGLLRVVAAGLHRLGYVTKKEREALQKARGYYVLELVPPCDGLPCYTNASMSSELDETSFRGAFLTDCREVIGEELLDSAYERKLPEDLLAYGQALLERANAWAEAHGVEAVREQRRPPEDGESPEGLAHIVFSSARWCIYWGQRGHFLDPWF